MRKIKQQHKNLIMKWVLIFSSLPPSCIFFFGKLLSSGNHLIFYMWNDRHHKGVRVKTAATTKQDGLSVCLYAVKLLLFKKEFWFQFWGLWLVLINLYFQAERTYFWSQPSFSAQQKAAASAKATATRTTAVWNAIEIFSFFLSL